MKIDIKFTKQSMAFIKDFPELSLKAIDEGFGKALLDVEGIAKRDFTRHLHVRTGHLRRSIYSQKTGFLKGYAGANLKYAAIHQYGGVIKPKVKKALSFKVGGSFITVKKVTIPARPYIIPRSSRIKRIMINHFEKVMQDAIK
jgi:phage gpG-like protein